MKPGDMVRFGIFDAKTSGPIRKIGLLVEYCKTMQIATILYEGETFRVHGRDVEKAGKHDL